MKSKSLMLTNQKESLCLGFLFFFIIVHCTWSLKDYNLFKLITFQELSAIERVILFKIRFPRIILAILAGAGLATAGVLSQTLFRNSLASPSILGISGASSWFACVLYYLNLAWLSWFIIPAGAFIGALLNLILLYLILNKGKLININKLLLAGLALSTFWGAMTSFIISISLEEHQKISSMMRWMLGGFSGLGWDHVKMVSVPLLCSMIFSYLVASQLNVFSLGEDIAKSLGIHVEHLKVKILLLIAILVAVIVSIVGILPFVGLLVPHLTRLILGNEHKKLLVFSMINGASLTLFADFLAKYLRAPIEMDVGIFTSLLGAPFFIFLLWQQSDKL